MGNVHQCCSSVTAKQSAKKQDSTNKLNSIGKILIIYNYH